MRHYNVSSVLKICKHCNSSFEVSDKPKGWMANHSRWCDSNPKRFEYANNMDKARSSITKDSRIKAAKSIKALHESGRYDHIDHKTFLGKKHTDASKMKIKEKALASKHRRLRKGIVEYKGILLDSSWELALAKRLDDLNIKWIRPDPIEWKDTDGVIHNYFADFYLTEYDLYLDPKNPHAINVQKQKLDILLKQYSNIKIIPSLEECNSFNILL